MSDGSKPTHHYGRGGAGNVAAKPAQSAQAEPIMTTPTLKSKIYTTGRGGTGNMARNDNAEEARVAQDVDIPGIKLPEGPHHTGRGGAANTYTPDDSERLKAHEHNKQVRRESFNKSQSKERAGAGVKALAEKAKEALTGKSVGEQK